jgi:hypothetical protein
MNAIQDIDWRAIAISNVISLIAGAVIGFGWGIIGLVVFATSGEEGIEVVLSPVGYIVGFIVSLIPVVIGVNHLLQSVAYDELKHCILFAVVNLIISFLFIFAAGDYDFAWHDILYYASIIPTAMISKRIIIG